MGKGKTSFPGKSRTSASIYTPSPNPTPSPQPFSRKADYFLKPEHGTLTEIICPYRGTEPNKKAVKTHVLKQRVLYLTGKMNSTPHTLRWWWRWIRQRSAAELCVSIADRRSRSAGQPPQRIHSRRLCRRKAKRRGNKKTLSKLTF